MKLLFTQSSLASRHFSLLGPNILTTALFSNNLSLCSSPNMKDQVSHLCKTTGEIVVGMF
jgi:hypothetical protein